MANSIHTARWIGQIADQGWDLHLFSSIDSGLVNPDLRDITVHHSFYGAQADRDPSVKSRGLPLPSERLANYLRRGMIRVSPDYRLHQLARLVRRLQPDIVHSLEIQAGGYLTSRVKQKLGSVFPTWIATNWGSDIYLFGRLAAHADSVRSVLAMCDFYSCECERDVELAQSMGLNGIALPVLPNTGGFDLERTARLRQPGPTSDRRTIVLKGYQHFSGRALVGLQAIRKCADRLKGYRVAIYRATDDVKIAAELLAQDTGIGVDIIPPSSHNEMLRLFGKARIYLGLGISDAISTSLLEAIVMGAFPIQSCTSCADEWIEDGKGGLIVPPEDPDQVADALRRALEDDALVDSAEELNALVAAERLEYSAIKAQVVQNYESVVSGEPVGGS
jgi:glycosyltransferase involved in cell wall biosynthesis